MQDALNLLKTRRSVKPVELESLVEIVRGLMSYWLVLNQRPTL